MKKKLIITGLAFTTGILAIVTLYLKYYEFTPLGLIKSEERKVSEVVKLESLL